MSGFCDLSERRVGQSWIYSCNIAECKREFRFRKRKLHLRILCRGEGINLPDVPKTNTICHHRGDLVTTITGRVAGYGCRRTSVPVYECQHFREPVLMVGSPPCIDTLREQVPGATGRVCATCPVPREVEPNSLPIQDAGLTQADVYGIITGASAVNWPCLGAIAIAAHQQALGLAVADHGLKTWQRDELTRCGVRWVTHDQPNLADVRQSLRIPSDLRAWWKPWICLASPFRVSLWIDSDAVPVGPVADLLTAAETRPQVSTQRLWQDDGIRMYRGLVSSLFGRHGSEDILPRFAHVNSGVLAWHTGADLLRDWRAWCVRLMSDPELTTLCRVRDQAGLLVTLVDDAIHGRDNVDLLADEWNTPADYLPSRESRTRKPISLEPAQLLDTARQRHPGAAIVHWLGGVKPWKL